MDTIESISMDIKTRSTRRVAKDAGKALKALAKNNNVIFPPTWSDEHILNHCTEVMMENTDENGEDDEDYALEVLKRTFGTKERERQTKRKEPFGNNDVIHDDQFETVPLTKKGTPRKSAIVEVEDNRCLADAILEMAKICLKNHNKKGSSYMMAAKSIRACKHPIKDAKDADQLRGVGSKIADHIQEYLQSGRIARLEQLRSGKV
eukprot:gene11561-12944_t